MKKTLMLFALPVVLMAWGDFAEAGVTFLPRTSSSVGSGSRSKSPQELCQQYGYKQTHCDSPKELTTQCPYSVLYYKSCKCPSEYQYTKTSCRNTLGGTPSTESCDNKYACTFNQ